MPLKSKYDGAADGDWENCVRAQVTPLKGTEASFPYVQCLLYLVSSSIKISIFHITSLGIFWTDYTHTHTYIYSYILVI